MISIKYKNIIPAFCLLLLSLFSSLILLGVLSFDYSEMFTFAYLYSCIFVLVIGFNKKIKKFSAAMMVIYYLFIQAVGIPWAYIFSPNYVLKRIGTANNFYGEYIDKYIALSLLSISIILLAMMFERKKNSLHLSNRYTDINKKYQEELNKSFFKLGFFLLLFFTLYMLFELFTGKLYIGNYTAYKSIYNVILNYSKIGYWLSAIFICSCATKKQILVSIFVFSIPSFLLILTGSRNDFLYPLLIGIGIYSIRFRKSPKIIIVLASFFVFFISPFVIQFRTGNQLNRIDIVNNIFENVGLSLYEIGSQLSPVSFTFSWFEQGEGYAWGATYFFGVVGLVLGAVFPSIRNYYELSKYCIVNRLPGLGYSLSAELYFNFGIIGVIIGSFIIGFFIFKYESCLIIENTKDILIYGFVMLWLLMLVRNSFGYSFVYAIIFFALYYGVICFHRLRGDESIKHELIQTYN